MYREDALQIALAGIEAVKPGKYMPQQVQANDRLLHIAGRRYEISEGQKLRVAAVGKAAAAMAKEVEHIAGHLISAGLVVTKYEHTLPLRRFHTIEAGHPLPDNNSVKGAGALSSFFKQADPNDLILLLVSGGASALVTDIPEACSLDDIMQTVKLLLDCGADIHEMNTIRKHLSSIKGGGLITQTQATVEALILSDVPGDDLSVIASGLTVPDPSSFQDAWTVFERYDLTTKIPVSIRQRIQYGLKGGIEDTPKPGSSFFEKVRNTLVASNTIAVQAAAKQAEILGYQVFLAAQTLTGDATRRAQQLVKDLTALQPPKCCYLSGGETTVVVTGSGKGGRNQHFALSALEALETLPGITGITVAAVGTDGTDGPTDAAGAIADEALLQEAKEKKLDISLFLKQNDAFHFFEQTGALIITGPTQTNVMDLIVGLINRS